MSDKKIIAVAGATGAQASGLVHSILKDKDGPYSRPRVDARSVERKGARPRRRGRGGRRGERGRRREPEARVRRRLRRVLRDVLLGALLARSGDPARHRARQRVQGDRRAARDLVHLRRRAAVHGRSRSAHAAPHGSLPRAALRREGRSRRGLPRSRRADDVLPDVVLLGELHLLRLGPEEGPRRQLRPDVADRRQEDAEHRRGGSREGGVRDLQGRQDATSARPLASPASTSPARRWRRR